MRRADYMASIVKQLGKLSTDALKYLDQWSFPWGVVPILRAYDDGDLLRRVDCDMEVALAMEEIVRCRDCVFFISDVSTVDEYGEQIATGNLCEWTELWVKPDGYCAWAERRQP